MTNKRITAQKKLEGLITKEEAWVKVGEVLGSHIGSYLNKDLSYHSFCESHNLREPFFGISTLNPGKIGKTNPLIR